MPLTTIRTTVYFAAILLLVHRDIATGTSTLTNRAVAPSAIAARLQADGKALYLEHCKACHGVVGAPTKQSLKKYKKIPNFMDAAFFAGRSEDSLMVVVKKGAGRDMKALADKLSADEIRAVSKYITTLVRKK